MRQNARMQIVGPATEDEMILAFLTAELNSPARLPDITRGELTRHFLGDPALVTAPDLENDDQNAHRRRALGELRGFGREMFIFQRWPSDVAWKHVTLTVQELASQLLMNYDSF